MIHVQDQFRSTMLQTDKWRTGKVNGNYYVILGDPAHPLFITMTPETLAHLMQDLRNEQRS